MNKTGVIVINLNTLTYTRKCIEDLLKQNVSFDLTLIDQASVEVGIKELFESVKKHWKGRGRLTIKYNSINEPLNEVWNTFAKESDNEYLCYLNSDVRIPCNFIKDSESVFSLEPTVGITVHSTNQPHWLDNASYQLNYKIPPNQKIKQGWDFTIRKSDWKIIPEIFQIFYGDDFIFYKLLLKNRKIAYILNSPILHFQGMSQGKNYRAKLPPRKDNFTDDTKAWNSTGWPHNHHSIPEYTRIKPTLALAQRYEKGIL
jgi:GT2 family glycosyltransferase